MIYSEEEAALPELSSPAADIWCLRPAGQYHPHHLHLLLQHLHHLRHLQHLHLYFYHQDHLHHHDLHHLYQFSQGLKANWSERAALLSLILL